MFSEDLFGEKIPHKQKAGRLSSNWQYPPFSVLNARDGWWQERKRQWLALGIKSELGRGVNGFLAAPGGSPMVSGYDKNGKRLVGFARAFAQDLRRGEHQVGAPSIGRELTTEEFLAEHYEASDAPTSSGTSIFDPVLCELSYRWFCPPGGNIIDPFAGGSVRGIVASYLGRAYYGCELREEQVAANRTQASIASDPTPRWVCDDSRNIAAHFKAEMDFVFSCPPYADLEVYSDDPRDLSAMDYPAFIAAYREIIAAACGLLKENRFACFVVAEVRDPKGHYRNFVCDTVEAFRAVGLHYYNEAILVTAVGSLPIRAEKQMTSSRKLGKTHQNVLVFVKGDAKKAAEALAT